MPSQAFPICHTQALRLFGSPCTVLISGISRRRFVPYKYTSYIVTSKWSQNWGCLSGWDGLRRTAYLLERTRFDIKLSGAACTPFRLLAQRRDGVVTPGDCWVYWDL